VQLRPSQLPGGPSAPGGDARSASQAVPACVLAVSAACSTFARFPPALASVPAAHSFEETCWSMAACFRPTGSLSRSAARSCAATSCSGLLASGHSCSCTARAFWARLDESARYRRRIARDGASTGRRRTRGRRVREERLVGALLCPLLSLLTARLHDDPSASLDIPPQRSQQRSLGETGIPGSRGARSTFSARPLPRSLSPPSRQRLDSSARRMPRRCKQARPVRGGAARRTGLRALFEHALRLSAK